MKFNKHEKLNWFEKKLIKVATNIINKYKTIYVKTDTRLLVHNDIYYIVSLETRSALGEVDSLQLSAHGIPSRLR